MYRRGEELPLLLVRDEGIDWTHCLPASNRSTIAIGRSTLPQTVPLFRSGSRIYRNFPIDVR
jgi:hypothetical protein